jgi:pimeloyl-ACP methyl ester carboxylesterase
MRPLSDTKWFHVSSAVGTTVFCGRPELRQQDKPVVLLIHGAMRSCGDLGAWFDLLEPDADVVLAALPGHGTAPKLTADGLEAFIIGILAGVRTLLAKRRVLIVGESLGGLVALGLNAHGYHSVTLDPFFSTQKLWPMESSVRQAMGRGVELDGDFLFEVFGLRDGVLVEERDYGGVLDRLSAPALVVTGDVPLNPPRDVAFTPSLTDEEDHALLAAHPNVRVRVLAGAGHDLLGDAQLACRELILTELGAI